MRAKCSHRQLTMPITRKSRTDTFRNHALERKIEHLGVMTISLSCRGWSRRLHLSALVRGQNTHVMSLGTGAALTVAGPRIGSLWTTAQRFYRANESDHPPRSGCFGTLYLGHSEARSISAGSQTLVAGLLSLCAPPRITTDSAWAAVRARWQVSGATKPPAYPSNGSRKNQQTIDGAGSAVLSLTASATLNNLSVNEARRRHAKWPWAARFGISAESKERGN